MINNYIKTFIYYHHHYIIMKKNTLGKKVKCHNCGYVWTTKSDRKFVTCSNCQFKTLRDKKGGSK